MIRKNKKHPASEMNRNEIAVAVSAGEIIVAAFEPITSDAEGKGSNHSPEIIMKRFSASSENLSSEISSWANAENIAFNLDTPFFLNCTEFHERTRVLSLPDDAPTDENDLPAWLIHSARTNAPGADGKPLFGTQVDLDNTAFLHFKLINGEIGLTSVPQRDLSIATASIVDFSTINTNLEASTAEPVVNLQIETPIRAIARYFFNTHPAPDADPLTSAATAFLSISPKGYAYGIYSPRHGDLIYETAEPFDKKPDEAETDFFAGIDVFEDDSNDDIMREKIDHAIKEMRTDFRKTLKDLEIENIGTLIWTTSAEMQKTCESVIGSLDQQIEFFPLSLEIPVEEAIAYGLLLSTSDNSSIQTVNLVRDLVAQSDNEETKLKNLQAVNDARHKKLTVYAMVLPLVGIIALTFGLLIDTVRSSRALTAREAAAKEEQSTLAPTLQIWNSYSDTFKIYETYTKQVITLRTGQDRAINLFTELDSRYPLALDGSFFVSDLKLAANGSLEMKGMARDEKAITAFVQSLETSQIAKDNKYEKTFGASLTLDLQRGINKSQDVAMSSAPDVVVWSVKGNYAPMTPPAPPAAPNSSNNAPLTGAVPTTSNQTNPALMPASNLKPNQVVKSAAGGK